MAQIYFRNGQGKRVTVEVSDEVAKAYRDELRREWNNNAYENYHSVSLDEITNAGHDFADISENIEEEYISHEDELDQAYKLSQLSVALKTLTLEQRELVEKVYFRGMSQDEIAKQEGVCKQAISNRLQRIYIKLKKIF